MKCPRCNSDCPDAFAVCQCGYDRRAASAGRPVLTEQMGEPAVPEDGSGGGKDMVVGALWCIGGSVMTYLSYQSAAGRVGGGKYYVFYGAIIFGALQFFRGMMR